MTTRALAMPDYVADLIVTTLNRMRLEPIYEEDFISCGLLYEDGTALELIVMCVAKRRWLRERPLLTLSAISRGNLTRAVQVHLRDTMDVPDGPNDLQFMVRLVAKVRATAWSLAETSRMGECLSLPGRHNFG